MFRLIYFLCVSVNNNSSGVMFPVFKFLDSYVTRSSMDTIEHLKVYHLILWHVENFGFIPNGVNISLPNIMSYLPIAESSIWWFHVKVFFVISSDKSKSSLIFRYVVILIAFMFHCTIESFSGLIVYIGLFITFVELYSLSNKI